MTISGSAPGTTVSGVTTYDAVDSVPAPPRYPAGVREVGVGVRLLAYFLEAILQAVTLGIGWLIWAALIVKKGQTPAKQLLKLRVIDANDSRPLRFARMFFMRGIVAGLVAALLIPLTLGIILLMPFWNKRNRNIWDVISGSVVVVDSGNAWKL
jgi:uncharacterized RDD family membrane protein YckC